MFARAFAQEQASRFIYSYSNSFIVTSTRASNPVSAISRISFATKRVGLEFRNNYWLKDVNSVAIYALLPTRIVDVGGEANYFGNEWLNATSQTLLVSKRLAKKLSLGVGFSHHFFNQAGGYPDHHFFAPSVGVSIEASSKLLFSSCFRNIAFKNDFVQQCAVVGASYKIDKFVVHGQYRNILKGNDYLDFAGEFFMNEKVALILKASTGDEPFGVGCDTRLWGVNVALECNYHKRLGASMQVDAYKQW